MSNDIAITKLQELIAALGTQKAVAQALGISAQYVNDLVHGRRAFSDGVLGMLGLERAIVPQAAQHDAR